MKKEQRTIYYEDELHDEFSTAKIETKYIGADYKYLREGFFGRVWHFFLYRIVFSPIAFFYTKLALGHRRVGNKLLKKHGKQGYFLYGNHTQDIGDAFMPNMLDFGREKHFIVHANNVSMPFLGRLTPYLGALPLPADMRAAWNFSEALGYHVKKRRAIVIYPEGHIWPFYTRIRPFTADSFSYPVRYGLPAFCFTNVYKKRGKRGFRIVTVIDGPFYPDPAKGRREAAEELRDMIYERMRERAGESEIEVIRYERKISDK